MELYELVLHFPDKYASLGNKELILNSVDYYESPDEAIKYAKMVAESFVTPKPDFFYLSDGSGFTIWTNDQERTKAAIKYDLLTAKPIINEL